MIDRVIDKKIGELVISNYLSVSVLHYFGIDYQENFDCSLRDLAQERGLNLNLIVSRLDQIDQKTDFKKVVKDYPLDWVLAYLRHSHRTYVTVDLPYLAELIDAIDVGFFSQPSVAKDLKLIFPVFVDEFIHHLHEEEDTLFAYIGSMLRVDNKPKELFRFLFQEGVALKTLQSEHKHEDEMSGIRELTSNFGIKKSASIHEIVVMKALEAFDESLQLHASIEDEVLFKQAIALEQKLSNSLSALSKLN